MGSKARNKHPPDLHRKKAENLESKSRVVCCRNQKGMCFRVECKQCGKTSWGGCGKHLKDLYAGIEQGKHCMCRSWPGVAVPNQHQGKTATQQQSLASASGK
nr:uncharacterized protein LOC108169585 [Malus domestica]